MTEQRHDPTSPTPPAPPESRQNAAVGAGAHLASVLIAVVLVPIAYLLLDYAVQDVAPRILSFREDSTIPSKVWVSVGAASGLMLVAAGVGRLSGLGPLVAGLLWGVAPTVVMLLRPLWFVRRVHHLPDFYDFVGSSLASYGLFVFPATGAMLIASGLGGRWRRRR